VADDIDINPNKSEQYYFHYEKLFNQTAYSEAAIAQRGRGGKGAAILEL